MTPHDRHALIDRLCDHRVDSGLLNCHHIGLHSIVLDRRADGSLLRIFYASPEHRMYRLFAGDGSFTVAAHNHDKNLRFTVLFGVVHNVALEYTHPHYDTVKLLRYPFMASALETGNFALGSPKEVHCQLLIAELDGRHIFTSEFHTVLVPSMTAAWLVDEGPQQKEEKYIFSPTPLHLDTHMLYIPMTKPDLADACDAIATAMEVTSE